VAEQSERLLSASPEVRAGAAEALGFLRAYEAQDVLLGHLDDASPLVRREAAMALAWCGDRKAVPPLLTALADEDWVTRQAAHVALANLTGMEFPFDSTAPLRKRMMQVNRWRDWWNTVPPDRPPKELLQLIGVARGWEKLPNAKHDVPTGGAARKTVTASSTYRGPALVLTDGYIGPEYWQTKNVPFPQSCTLDLGEPTDVFRVIVHQYGSGFVMTEYELATSLDNKEFGVVERRKGVTPVKLVVEFPKRKARYVRITSFGTKNPTYPTTFFEIEINRQVAVPRQGARRGSGALDDVALWQKERGVRALGALGGKGATQAILTVIGPASSTAPDQQPLVSAGIRALGRLRDESGLKALIDMLDNPFWARDAANALGDFGDRRAVPALLAAYPRYAKNLQTRDPRNVPRDDRMGFPGEDRMLETPYWIAYALCRLPLDDPGDRASLRKIAPLIMANLPGDFDTFFLYQPEVGHRLTRFLMEQSGLRQQACEHALVSLGQPRRVAVPADAPKWSQLPAYRISSWLPCVCTEAEDVPRLVALLQHKEGWVRLNAAKTLGWLGEKRAVEPIARLLAEAKAEADYGYSGTFKNEEYDDPAPRWREGLIRALGLLEAHEHTDLMVRILEDERSVVEIRRAAALALADLGNDKARAALREAALGHPFFIVRNAARDALRSAGERSRLARQTFDQGRRGADDLAPGPADGPFGLPARPVTRGARSGRRPQQGSRRGSKSRDPLNGIAALVFIKGGNNIPNTIGTVEQADRWRQTYVVTDSGPVYRPGRNLYVLRPPRPDGKVTPLTRFQDGYVGEPELSWDASHVIFTRRGQDDPWWQIYRVNVDGSDLVQLTHGPYHHVGPAYLPDGRIVFASSRNGTRDEYHGYPCTPLYVMNADGSDVHTIATNIGRDNEPSVLNDGRIVFSRLEVFYSRNKTELTLHAAHPDGTQDVVLYGPERRRFWRSLDHGPRTPADGQEAPLTHRVLRMTQPQPMPNSREIIVATQGGLALIGPRRDRESIITPENKTRAYTTPFPLPGGEVLCASALKIPDRKKIDLGLYLFDPATEQLELIYNDPATADFEPRPILARCRPPILTTQIRRGAYSGRFMCSSVFATQEKAVLLRGRLVRLIEGVPVPNRHSTHTNPWPVWRNHGGTFARVLGTVPIAADGSFHVSVPADRLMHFQVLDSDRRVVGNQLTWISPRPGETKSCVGCHEDPHSDTVGNDPLASHYPPVDFLPKGDEFTYRAKAWFKGHLPDKIEERTRTVRAVSLLGR